jgi:hypothetical protein
MGRGRQRSSCSFLGVHALECFILKPDRSSVRRSIFPPPLFSLSRSCSAVGVRIWGSALALPLIAVAKVVIDYFKADDTSPEAVAA